MNTASTLIIWIYLRSNFVYYNLAHPLDGGDVMGSILGPNRVVSFAIMSDERQKEYEKVECLGPKQAQLITRHIWDFQT